MRDLDHRCATLRAACVSITLPGLTCAELVGMMIASSDRNGIRVWNIVELFERLQVTPWRSAI
jgi:hypothetical protein